MLCFTPLLCYGGGAAVNDELQRIIGELMARIVEMEKKIERLQGLWAQAIKAALAFLAFVAGLYLHEKGLW